MSSPNTADEEPPPSPESKEPPEVDNPSAPSNLTQGQVGKMMNEMLEKAEAKLKANFALELKEALGRRKSHKRGSHPEFIIASGLDLTMRHPDGEEEILR
jgi:hypothetical protein